MLASVRYRNPGQLSPYTFTEGVRTVMVQVSDGAGGFATVNATVKCVPEQRIGVVGRDPKYPAPADCSGHGELTVDSLTVRCQRMRVHLASALTLLCLQGRHVL